MLETWDDSIAVSAAPLVGRAGEVQALAAELGRARCGEARIVMVTGEAGIGKSRLCREILARADGLRPVMVTGEESESDLAYGVLDRLLAGLAGRAARAAPTSAPHGPNPFAAGAALVQALSDAQTGEDSAALLVVVDDLHWVDRPSQQALLFALRRLTADTVCTVLCVRTGEERRLLPGLLRLLDDPGCRRIDLTGLDAAAIHELAAYLTGPLPAGAVRRIRDHTGGNPLWVGALLRELPTDRLLDSTSTLPAPRSFAALTTARLAALGEPARALVETCAVAGAELPVGMAATVAQVAHPFEALAEAGAAGLLREVAGTPPRVRTTHALVTSAVYGAMDPARRVALHRALAQTAGTEHERLRHEVAASPGPDDALADRLVTFAGGQVAQQAWESAASLLTQAAHLVSDQERRWHLLADATAAALMAGDPRGAESLLAQIRETGDRPRTLGLAGWAKMLAGRHSEAERLLQRAVDTALAVGDVLVVVEASNQLGHLLALLGRFDEALANARRALEHAPADSVHNDVAHATTVMVLAVMGRHAEAEAMAADVDAQRLSPTRLHTAVARATNRVTAGRCLAGLEDIAAVTGVASSRGDFHLLCVAYAYASRAHYLLGDWDAAVIHAERAVRAVADAELVWAAAPVHAFAATVHARLGQWSEATAHVDRSVQAARLTSEPMSLAYAGTAVAVLAHSRGDLPGVTAAVQPLLSSIPWDVLTTPGVFDWPVLYLEALACTGGLAQLDAWLPRFQAAAERNGETWLVAAAERIRGQFESARDRHRAATAHLDRATRLAEEASVPFEAALAQSALGDVLSRLGRRDDATAALTAALGTFDRLGAAPFAKRARARLSALGRVPQQRMAVQTLRLTPQELTVAGLVRRGLSNREIADELFLSTKTVEFHLRNAFLKLGVSSRTQLVAQLAAEA